MKWSKTVLSIFLFSYSAGAITPTEYLQQMLLVNDRNRNQITRVNNLGSPFAVLFAFNGRQPVLFCNGFQGYRSEQEGWAFTAGHCYRQAKQLGANQFYFAYFDKNGKQTFVESRNPPHQPAINFGPNSQYRPDLAAFPVDLKESENWDFVNAWAAIKKPIDLKTAQTFFIYAYRLDINPRQLAQTIPQPQFKKYRCQGNAGSFPRIQASYQSFTQVLPRISYSQQNADLDEQLAIFLDQCSIPAGVSGALITDQQNIPVGALFDSLEVLPSFKDTWLDSLAGRFERELPAALRDSITLKSITFQLLPALPNSQPATFNLEETRTLYSVGLNLLELSRLDPSFEKSLLRK